MRCNYGFVAVSFLIFSGTAAWGWNDVGHMTVARIAYEQLTDGERAIVVEILRHHPHLQELLLKDRPANASKGEWIFLRAATWPDNVRPPREHLREPVHVHPVYRFHHATWHYANFEYRSGQYDATLPSQPLPLHPVPANVSDRTNIIEQLDHSYLIVRGRERETSEPEIELSPQEIRAIRLCWLLHLMGDIHQPLHVATLVNPLVPALQHGDEGGNKLGVRINSHSAPKKLHALWDDLLGTNAHFDKIVQLAEKLSHDPRTIPAHLPEFAKHRFAWEFAEESYQAAKEVVYQNGRHNYALWSPIETHDVSIEQLPVLSPEWLQQAHAVAERRVALAGYRLAERLKYIVQQDAANVESIGTIDPAPRRVTPSRHVVR